MSKSLIRPQEPCPVISALIVNKNHGACLEETIMSVLAQQYQDFEKIVGESASNDCSVDVTKKSNSESRLSWFSEPDLNEFHAWNKSLGLARGNIVRTLDATDKFLPDASNKAVREFNEDARLAMVGGGIRYLQANGQDEGKSYQLFKESVNLSIE